jgi:hypothetical protein
MMDGLISIGGGVVACYYGFRNPPVSRDPIMTAKWQHWHERWSAYRWRVPCAGWLVQVFHRMKCDVRTIARGRRLVQF